MGVDKVIKEFDSTIQPESIVDSIQDIISTQLEQRNEKTIMFEDSSTKDLHASDYLFSIAPHISEELISSQNFSEIKNIAQHLTGNLTSFFGFETRLGSSEARSDYLIAVSSQKGEREALLNLIKNGGLPDKFLNKQEWKNVGIFTKKWADSESEINKNVLGLWLEFDTANITDNSDAPNIFLQIRKTRIDSEEDERKFKWITQKALPILTGTVLPKSIEENLINAVKKMPEETSLIHVGTMLSRQIQSARIVINRIKPEQIIPYLNSIGWKNETDELKQIIEEISKYVSRLILHINIGETVDSKIGIECSFAEDKYHLETKWEEFFDYLENKGLCTQEKRIALLNFPGIEQEYNDYEFNFNTYMVAPKIKHNNYASALVRYLSHIKIVYKPNQTLEAKAYSGIRLFGMEFLKS